MGRDKKESNPYGVGFKASDIAAAFGISLLAALAVMLLKGNSLDDLASLPLMYFLFMTTPFLTAFELWHPLIVLPCLLIALITVPAIDRKVLRVISIAAVLTAWQAYGMFCAIKGMRIGW